MPTDDTLTRVQQRGGLAWKGTSRPCFPGVAARYVNQMVNESEATHTPSPRQAGSSWRNPSWAIRDARHPALGFSEKSVLFAVASRMSPGHEEAWPTERTLAADAGGGERQGRRAVATLKRHGFLRVRSQPTAVGHHNVYGVNVDALLRCVPANRGQAASTTGQDTEGRTHEATDVLPGEATGGRIQGSPSGVESVSEKGEGDARVPAPAQPTAPLLATPSQPEPGPATEPAAAKEGAPDGVAVVSTVVAKPVAPTSPEATTPANAATTSPVGAIDAQVVVSAWQEAERARNGAAGAVSAAPTSPERQSATYVAIAAGEAATTRPDVTAVTIVVHWIAAYMTAQADAGRPAQLRYLAEKVGRIGLPPVPKAKALPIVQPPPPPRTRATPMTDEQLRAFQAEMARAHDSLQLRRRPNTTPRPAVAA